MAFDAPTAHPGQESRSSPIEEFGRRLRLTKLSQVRTTLVVGVLLAAAAFALSSLVFMPRVPSTHAGSRDLRSQRPAHAHNARSRKQPRGTCRNRRHQPGRQDCLLDQMQRDTMRGCGGILRCQTWKRCHRDRRRQPRSPKVRSTKGSRQWSCSNRRRFLRLLLFIFEVTGVPNSATYGITVGHDGAFYNRQQLVADHWSPSVDVLAVGVARNVDLYLGTRRSRRRPAQSRPARSARSATAPPAW